jgi:sulfite exporter TauE/SafE
MLFFGVGTLPAMLTMSIAADSGRRLLQKKTTRRAAGILLIGFGLWTLMTPLQQLTGGHTMPGHQHQH